MTAIIFFLWRLVWSKFSMLLGTAATCVWVIWLYNQNMNIIIYTHTPLTSYPWGLLLLQSSCGISGHLPTLAAWRFQGRDCFYTGVLPHCGAGNSSSSDVSSEKSGSRFLKYLCCIVPTALVLLSPFSSQMLCIKTGIGFSVFRNLISRVDCNSYVVNDVTQNWIA